MSNVFNSSSGKAGALKIRLGCYDDFTTAPIVSGLDGTVKSATVRRAGCEEVCDLFKNGELEAALLPVPEILRTPQVDLVPASAISAVGASRVFMIFSKKLPTEIRRVLVDPNDFGGEYLARVVMAKKLMVRPEFVRTPTTLDPAKYNLMQNDGFDAYLLTGRNCFFVRRDAFAFSLDLTQAWYELTQLPYVIHAWVVRRGYRLGTLDREIGDTARRNETNRDLAARAAERAQMMESGVRQVYEKAFLTRFDSQVIAAIRQFAKELVQGQILRVAPPTLYQPPVTAKRAGTA